MPVRRIAAACVLVLALATPVAAWATGRPRSERHGGLERPDRIEHRADGLSILTYNNLPGDAPPTRAKSVFPYIVYASISRPGLSGGIDAFDVTPLESARYYYSLVVVNFSNSASTRAGH